MSRHTLSESKALGAPSERGRFLRIDDVIATTGLSRTTIYREISAASFPAPTRLTARAVGWWEASIAEWLESRRSTA